MSNSRSSCVAWMVLALTACRSESYTTLPADSIEDPSVPTSDNLSLGANSSASLPRDDIGAGGAGVTSLTKSPGVDPLIDPNVIAAGGLGAFAPTASGQPAIRSGSANGTNDPSPNEVLNTLVAATSSASRAAGGHANGGVSTGGGSAGGTTAMGGGSAGGTTAMGGVSTGGGWAGGTTPMGGVSAGGSTATGDNATGGVPLRLIAVPGTFPQASWCPSTTHWTGCSPSGALCREQIAVYPYYSLHRPACEVTDTCAEQRSACPSHCPVPVFADSLYYESLECAGISGGWNGCRGSGCLACVELLVDYPKYFDRHPACKPNCTCSGGTGFRTALCSAACPAPTDADK